MLQEVLLRSGPCSAHPTGANRKETGRLRFHLTSVKERTDSNRSQSKLRGDFFPSATRGECLGKMTRQRGFKMNFPENRMANSHARCVLEAISHVNQQGTRSWLGRKRASAVPHCESARATHCGKMTQDNEFLEGLVKSGMMILLSEIGDKTFFIAAIMAMRHSRLTVRPLPRARESLQNLSSH